MMHVFSHTFVELSNLLDSRTRAQLIWRALRQGIDPRKDDRIPAGILRRMAAIEFGSPSLQLKTLHPSSDGTLKLVFEVSDLGFQIETVLIPARSRTTVCVSTQVGCARACSFCVTGRDGLKKNLSTSQILWQVFCAIHQARENNMPAVRNIVFMGMGEPLDNFVATSTAVDLLVDECCFSLSPNRVTVSTVGPSIKAILQASHLPCCLAWSVHAADDATRQKLVPTTKFKMLQLRHAFLDAAVTQKRTPWIEITLVDGINDTTWHAEALAEFLSPFEKPLKVNVIAMNPGMPGLDASSASRVQAFQEILYKAGYFCTLRRPRGTDAHAACGQLSQSR